MKLLIKIGLYMLAAALLLLGVAYFVALTYKDEILVFINKEFSNRINGDLKVKDLDYTVLETFPNFSFTLVEPTITDTLYSIHKQPLFRAEKVFMQFSLPKLFRNEMDIQAIQVNNGSVSLFKGKNGYESWRIFKSDSARKETSPESTSMDFMLKKVKLNNVSVRYTDSTSQAADSSVYKTISLHVRRLQADIRDGEKGMDFDLYGPVKFDQLTFNPSKGSYLKNAEADLDLHLFYDKTAKNLLVNKSSAKINKKDYQLAGNLQLGKVPVLSLNFQTDAAIVTDVLPLLTQRIADKIKVFKIKQPVKASASIRTLLMKGNVPDIEILFSTAKATVNYKKEVFTDLNLSGRYFSKSDSSGKELAQEFIEMKEFSGKYENLPVQATYTITNLKNPDIDLIATLGFSLKEANHLLDNDKMKFAKGTANINFQYKGKLEKVLDETNVKLPGSLKGKATLKDATFDYLPRQFKFAGINGTVQFNQSDATIDSLRFRVNDNQVNISGKLKDLVPFALYKHDKVQAQLKMFSPTFDFGNFKSPGTLRTLGLLPEKDEQRTSDVVKKAIAQKIEALIENVDCNLAFNIQQMKYKQFTASKIQGNVTLEDNNLGLENVSLNNSNGVLKLNGAIRNISQPKGELAIQATIQNADVRKLFYSFENFKQKTLEEKNLMGELHADISFSSGFDDSYTLFPESMQGNFEIQLTNGRLIDFEPLTKVGKVVFKQRDFTNIEFADIRNSFELQGQDLRISRMEIASSVLNLFVEGIFSFNKETDLVIQLPLSNLSLKENKEIIPEKMGENQDAGASVYLRARAANGQEKVKITYDPFKKGLKELRKEDTLVSPQPKRKRTSRARQ